MKIALCLFGQWRTGDYCLPWLLSQYRTLTEFASSSDIDVYCYLKSYAYYPNSRNPKAWSLTESDPVSIAEELRKTWFGPKIKRLVITSAKDEKFKSSRARWHYASLFSHIQAAGFDALRTHDSGESKYNLILFQRPDALVGPYATSLPDALNKTDWTRNSFLHIAHWRSEVEARQQAVNDMFFGGHPDALSKVLSYTMVATQNPTSLCWQRLRWHGPNTLLASAAQASALDFVNLNLEVALVRPHADLSMPALSSFSYHRAFWISDHKGM